jgi:hypothetical protein
MTLDRMHNYYYQVQGQLFVLREKRAIFACTHYVIVMLV